MSILKALSADGALDLWSVRFQDQSKEGAFKTFSVDRNGLTERFIMFSGAGLHLSYGVLDALTIGDLATSTIIVRLLGFLLIIPAVAWTLTSLGKRNIMWVASFVVVVMAVSMGIMIQWMGTITPPYYVGFIHLSLVFCSVVQINFRVCAALLLFNYATFLYAMPVIPNQVDLVAAHFFLVATFISCATVNYVLERSRRLEFVEYREKQRYFDQVREMRDAAEGSLRRRNALLNVLGHVVKTPLHQVIGYAQVIEQTAKMSGEETEIPGFADEIVRAGQTLSHQSQRILDYSRAEAGLLNISLQTTTPKRLISEVTHKYLQPAEDKKVAIKIDCEETPVFVDPRHMARGLDELVGNAVAYCPPGSTITIRSRMAAERIVLSIMDDGPGIPESEIARVSDALNQTDEFKNVGGDRLGIGVSLARILIRISGGELLFSSAPDKGCLAEIVLFPPEAAAGSEPVKLAS